MSGKALSRSPLKLWIPVARVSGPGSICSDAGRSEQFWHLRVSKPLRSGQNRWLLRCELWLTPTTADTSFFLLSLSSALFPAAAASAVWDFTGKDKG